MEETKMEKNNYCVFDLSTEGLEPLKHRILGITTKTEDEERIFTQRDEKALLSEFWAYVEAKQFQRLIGFNSDNFDVPMLIVRSIKHKVEIPCIKDKLVDLRKVIIGYTEHRKGTLDDFKDLLEISFFDSRYRNMHMSLLWETEDIPKLREFLLRDVKVTWQLYEHVSGAGLI